MNKHSIIQLIRDLEDYLLIKRSGLFDSNYYCRNYPDVRLADINPLWHFIRYGWSEGRNPNVSFNCSGYLTINPSVKNSGINPLIDFIRNNNKRQRKKNYPLVSVIVMSYNQEAYIKQCIDSILKQQRNFKMEVILGDDASTDDTRKILQEYTKNFPDLFFQLPKQENLGYTRNLKRCLSACKGEYIAFCDGDDYWTDVNKLKKQLELLYQHPDLSMCFSAIELLYEEDQRLILHQGQQAFKSNSLTFRDFFSDNIIATFTCCLYRADIISCLPEKLFDVYVADWIFNFCCAHLGHIGFIKEAMSVYRIHSKGSWSGKSRLKQLEQSLLHIDDYDSLLDFVYHEEFCQIKERIRSLLETPKDNED